MKLASTEKRGASREGYAVYTVETTITFVARDGWTAQQVSDLLDNDEAEYVEPNHAADDGVIRLTDEPKTVIADVPVADTTSPEYVSSSVDSSSVDDEAEGDDDEEAVRES